MPFQSQQQEKYLWATHPKIARQWQKETPKGTTLPKKVNEKIAQKGKK